MNGKHKWLLLTMVSTALISFAATAVIATGTSSNTPLYTYRMEQASAQMNFLSTDITEFTYTAENGYTVKFDNVHGTLDENGAQFAVQPDGTYYPTCTYICPLTQELSCKWCINTIC